MNRCQFVDDHQRRHGVKRLCDILGLARSSFCYWRRTAAARAARQAVEADLAARIRKVHQDSDGTYGAPRITAELRDEGGPAVNHKRVARIMRTIGLEAVRLRRRHRTTVADQAAAKAPDLLGRNFTAATVNTKYVGDITYLPVSGGKPFCLATVIELASRRLAGWAIADHMRAELVIDALAAAERTRGSLAGAVMRTDHGSQYTSRAFAEICRSAGVRQSMGAIGSSADNAAAESFNAALKRETLTGRKAWPSELTWVHRESPRMSVCPGRRQAASGPFRVIVKSVGELISALAAVVEADPGGVADPLGAAGLGEDLDGLGVRPGGGLELEPVG
ncbi:IS3 family transposase [Streptomyces lavendulae]|uniref:IS3 family transposase n=1 Tax=Streptomyces lavendulae TaxID=1914 RepID=UPI00371F0EB1